MCTSCVLGLCPFCLINKFTYPKYGRSKLIFRGSIVDPKILGLTLCLCCVFGEKEITAFFRLLGIARFFFLFLVFYKMLPRPHSLPFSLSLPYPFFLRISTCCKLLFLEGPLYLQCTKAVPNVYK